MKLPILMYHSISEPPEGILKNLCVPPSVFKKQMNLLKRMGYKVMSLSEGMNTLKNNPKRGGVISLTFDDGYDDNLISAVPVLKEHGFTATCFFVAKYRGSSKFDKWGDGERRLMDSVQIKEWVSMGMEVGSHTLTHRNLVYLDNVEARTEISESRLILSNIAGDEVKYFAYPFGAYDSKICDMVENLGYLGAVTVKSGFVKSKTKPYELPRIGISPQHSATIFLLKSCTTLVDLRQALKKV
jgi:peptidoglycan/xylan/chitin deacetylase (PgdA/CDA1 family)